MEKFIGNLKEQSTEDLNSMFANAKGLEKDLIEPILLRKIYHLD